MSDNLESIIMEKIKTAMKEKDTLTRDALRSITTEFKQKKIDDRLESLSSDEQLAILKKMVKQRKDSVEQYIAGGRQDLADKEVAEITIIEQFLPKQLSTEEIAIEVTKAIEATNATSPKEMGKVIAALGHLKSVADMGAVSKIVKAKLS